MVKVISKIEFPNRGWLFTHTAGPHNGRYLVEIRGCSGMSSWPAGLATFPEAALESPPKECPWSEDKLYLLPATYAVQEGEDKRGHRLLRFYRTLEDTNCIAFSANGFLVPEASTPGVQALLECEGYSRTGKNGSRWTLIAAPTESIVAIEPYESQGDPIYYRVTEEGIVELGATDAVLAPDEW